MLVRREPILKAELEVAVQNMKKNKTLKPDNITFEERTAVDEFDM